MCPTCDLTRLVSVQGAAGAIQLLPWQTCLKSAGLPTFDFVCLASEHFDVIHVLVAHFPAVLLFLSFEVAVPAPGDVDA